MLEQDFIRFGTLSGYLDGRGSGWYPKQKGLTMAVIDDLNADLEALPDKYKKLIANGMAIIPSHISSHDFPAYLEALDEKVLREVYVRVGLNGSSRVILVAVVTNASERRRLNFPSFKMDKSISDYITELPAYAV